MRLDQLCEELNIPVGPWHGDITPTLTRNFMKRPQGVLLITPESLEAQFVLRGHELRRYFGALQYAVVDAGRDPGSCAAPMASMGAGTLTRGEEAFSKDRNVLE